jgi:two-component sensor histidine kinase
MKNISFKKHLVPLFHVLFWIVSFNFWNIVLNPSVESTASIQGFEVDWGTVLLLNSAFLIYTALPFTWLIKRRLIWLKLIATLLFVGPIISLIVSGGLSEQETNISVIADWYVRNFLYVIVFLLPIIASVYINLNILLVRYLNKSQFAKYLVFVAGLLVLSAGAAYSIFNFLLDKLFPNLYYISYFSFSELLLIIKVYLLISILVFLISQYVGMLIAKKEAMQNQLHSLKAQINPHFLFNNLNTIYSMATQNDRRTPETVLKLSDFLRYILYDTADEAILLQKEVEIIETYISLQKERINPEMTSVEFETKGDFSEVRIAPLLLLPLVENCFKHGVGKDSGSIRIFVELRDKQLHFQTTNTVALREFSGENGGIGIKNVEKRLNLIYPDRHSLEFQEENGIFKLEMKIQLA